MEPRVLVECQLDTRNFVQKAWRWGTLGPLGWLFSEHCQCAGVLGESLASVKEVMLSWRNQGQDRIDYHLPNSSASH